jgi:hypothetical protein
VYLSKDPAFCRCAYRYMIAVSVYKSKIVGIYGPYPGSYSELEIYQEHIKTKVKANKGNKDSLDRMLALPNPVNNQDNKKFKACVLACPPMSIFLWTSPFSTNRYTNVYSNVHGHFGGQMDNSTSIPDCDECSEWLCACKFVSRAKTNSTMPSNLSEGKTMWVYQRSGLC